MSSHARHDLGLRSWVASGSAAVSSLVAGGELWGLDLKACHCGVVGVLAFPTRQEG